MSRKFQDSTITCPICDKMLFITEHREPTIQYAFTCKGCNWKPKRFLIPQTDITLQTAYARLHKSLLLKFSCPECNLLLKINENKNENSIVIECYECKYIKKFSLSEQKITPEQAFHTLKADLGYGNMIEHHPSTADITRPQYKEIIEFIQHSVDIGKKFIIVNAPTGIGKSYIAANLCLYFKEGTILTDQKSLQQQYINEFSWMKQAKGKNNFLCPNLDFQKTCNFGHCKDCEFKCSIDDFEVLNRSTENEKVVFSNNSNFNPLKQQYRESLRDLEEIPSEEKTIFAFDLLNDKLKIEFENNLSEFLIKYNNNYYFAHADNRVPKGASLIKENENLIFKSKDVCPYYQQKFIAQISSYSVYNYSMYLKNLISTNRKIEFAKMHSLPEDNSDSLQSTESVLICDEAHLLPDNLKGSQDCQVDLKLIKNLFPDFDIEKTLLLGKNKKYRELLSELTKISNDLGNLILDQNKHSSCLKFLKSRTHINLHRNESTCMKHKKLYSRCKGCQKITQMINDGSILNCVEHLSHDEELSCRSTHGHLNTEENIKNQYYSLSDCLSAINFISKSIKHNDEAYTISIRENKITLEPLLMHSLASQLFEKFDHVIFLSSGIFEPFFINELGINHHLCTSKSFPNPIPKSNRKIFKKFVDEVGLQKFLVTEKNKTPYNEKIYDEQVTRIANGIIQILESHANEKGIIHVNSIKDQNHIQSKIQNLSPNHYDRLTFIDTEERDYSIKSMNNQDLLEIHKQKPNSVLLSSSMWFGVSLDGDEGKFCIIATPPFIPNDAYIEAKIKEDSFGTEWKEVSQAFKLIQGCGRCVRGIDDAAYTYILDKGTTPILDTLVSFTHQHPEFAWMTESIQDF